MLDPQQRARELQEQKKALRRFRWFVVILTLFCLLMIVWLPR